MKTYFKGIIREEVQKNDMITTDSGLQLRFSNMGKFVGGKNWTHPRVVTATYELIFVTDGEVYLEEAGERFILRRGDLLCLKAGLSHGGYRKSDDCAFFWLHFYADGYDTVGVYRAHLSDLYNAGLFFKELDHLAITSDDKMIIECKLTAFLLQLKGLGQEKNKLFSDVCEYIRVHIAEGSSVRDVAAKFGYSSDHLSKQFTAACGLCLKKYISRERNAYVKNLLVNTQMSVKEIADAANFEDDNAFVKFFKYNNGMTPTQFRNRCYASHTNTR